MAPCAKNDHVTPNGHPRPLHPTRLPPHPICSRARALNLVLGWGDCLGRPQGAVGVSTNSCFLKIEQYRRESTWVDGEGWGEGSPPHLRAKSHTLVRAAVPVWKKGSVVPSRQPSCNLPNSSTTVARLQIATVCTERKKQRLYLHRIIALVMT